MQCNNIDITEVKVLEDYKLYLKFEDGYDGEVDISAIIPFKGIFEPLKDKTFFAKVSINRDIGTICWENGADLSPTFLHKNTKT